MGWAAALTRKGERSMTAPPPAGDAITTSTGATRDIVVELEHGPARGIAHESWSVFYALPYAAPPTGAARFAAPTPAGKWRGTRDATQPGPTSPQPVRGAFGALDLYPYFQPGWAEGEDYLTLNVWAPRTQSTPAPVLVFLHGGGFLAGSSYSPLLDGRRFAEDGVAVVTVNYRLGITGFLDIPDTCPNRGLADVLAALAWVRHNIGRFGGDPARVTLAGQSAGATLTAAALASPDGSDLFHRAIMQSGNGSGAFSHEQAAIVLRAAASALDVAPTAAGFARLSDHQLVAATSTLIGLDLGTAAARDPLQRITPFGVVLDEQPTEVVARRAAQPVDLLVGHNADEGNLYVVPTGALDTTTPAQLRAAAAYAHADPARLVSVYSAIHPRATPGQLRAILLGEAAFGVGTRRLADAHARTPARTYAYEFTWPSSALGGRLGAAHVVETPFVFDNVLPTLIGEQKLLGPAQPAELSVRMHRAWVDFITIGSPGWPEYTRDERLTMRIGEHWSAVADPFRAERAAWT